MYSLTLLDDNLINRFDEDPSFSLQNSSPLTSSKRKQQYNGGLSDFLLTTTMLKGEVAD